jgi:cysteine desulfurase
MIYLDYAANTPVEEEVLDVYVKATRKYIANPNSSHPLGVEARKEIDECSKRIAKFFNTEKESVIYTSGSSESNNLVLKGIAEMNKNKGNKIIISAIEHSSIVAPCNYLAMHGYDVSVIPLTKDGMVDLDVLKKEMNDQTILVSICAVDSELGTIQPIQEIKNIVKEYDCIFHTDATQAIGKANINYDGVDFITFAPHKFFGLNGFGVLINRNNTKLTPLIHGGKSTTIFRSGTPATPLIASFAKALRLVYEDFEKKDNYIHELNSYFIDKLSKLDVSINSNKYCVPQVVNLSIKGIKPETMQHALEEYEIYISTQTACSTGDYSRAVYAVTHSKERTSHSIRVSLSYKTTYEEIDDFIDVFSRLIIDLNIRGD